MLVAICRQRAQTVSVIRWQNRKIIFLLLCCNKWTPGYTKYPAIAGSLIQSWCAAYVTICFLWFLKTSLLGNICFLYSQKNCVIRSLIISLLFPLLPTTSSSSFFPPVSLPNYFILLFLFLCTAFLKNILCNWLFSFKVCTCIYIYYFLKAPLESLKKLKQNKLKKKIYS